MNVSESMYTGRVMCLTSNTSNAFNVTLTVLVFLIKLFLNHGSYVLQGNFHSDRSEEEIEI